MPTSEDEVPVSSFSPEDARPLQTVHSTGRSVVVTSGGQPMVVVIKAPPVDSLLEVLRARTLFFQKRYSPESKSSETGRHDNADSPSWLGSASATIRITGDLIEPAVPPDDWEALRG